MKKLLYNFILLPLITTNFGFAMDEEQSKNIAAAVSIKKKGVKRKRASEKTEATSSNSDSQTDVQRPKRDGHPKIKKYYACKCGKSFTLKSALEKHKIKHTKAKPFKCTIAECHKSFANIHILEKHKKVHTGEKPFKCDQCSSCFASKGSLNQHLKVHERFENLPCTVPGCDQEFASKRSLTIHMRTHVKEKSTATQAPEGPLSLDSDEPLSAPLTALMPAASKEFDEILNRPLFSLGEPIPPLSALILPPSENR